MSQTDVAVRCSRWARDVDLSPIATIGSYQGYLLVETPLPWARDVGEMDLLAGVASRVGKDGIRLQALVPSVAAAPPAERRVILHYSPGADGRFSGYRRYEAEFGSSLDATVDSLVASAHAGAPDHESPGRDVLVCTHGRRDLCCGSQGTDLALQLMGAGAPDGVRFWRTSHTGGHRFAPTFLVLPEGTAWAFADVDLVGGVLDRGVPFADVAARYRGCSGLTDRRYQALEREVLSAAGWDVLDRPRRGVALDPTVRLEVEGPGGELEMWEAAVGDGRTLPVPDCMHPLSAAKKSETELVVSDLRRVA